MTTFLDRALDLLKEENERSFLITDPRLPDNPIVFANDAFVRLTGYSRDEVIGRNCRFLQGEGTDPGTVREIHRAVAQGTDITILILNFKKDGTPFWNRLRIRPIRSDSGEIEAFAGLQEPTAVGDECLPKSHD